jgi:hypothetical protein
MTMRLKTMMWVVPIVGMVSGCQLPSPRIGNAAPSGAAAVRLGEVLAGDYDNDEQVRQAHAGVHAGTRVAVPHLREQWRLLSHDRDHDLWLWHWQSQDPPGTATADWLYRVGAGTDAGHVVLTPFRAIDPAAVKTALADKKNFKFDAAQWAELTPCAMTGEWKNAQFSANTSAAACSVLLPGLGESASLLPLRLTLDGDMLRATTFADQARGTDAGIDARRLGGDHWGWSAGQGRQSGLAYAKGPSSVQRRRPRVAALARWSSQRLLTGTGAYHLYRAQAQRAAAQRHR